MSHYLIIFVWGTYELEGTEVGMKVDTIVSTDLLGIGNASGHPSEVIYYGKNVFVAWTGGFAFCHSVTKSMVILLNAHLWISVICRG